MIGSTPRFLTFQVGSTLLHKLDPRAKLLCTVGIVVTILIAGKPLALGAAALLCLAAALGARRLLPSLQIALRPLLLLIVLFGVIIVITTPGHALAHIGFIVPTRDGVALAVRLGIQALLIVLTTSLLTLTTPPLYIAGALQWSFGRLERFRLPVRDIIAMVAIGLTFVPLLLEEAHRVIAAQRARGATLGVALLEDESLGALVIPLLLANLRRGADLAESMDARLYGAGPRTTMEQSRFGRIDGVAAVVTLVGMALVLALSFSKLAAG